MSTPVTVTIKLAEYFKKKQRKIQTEERIVNSFESEAKTFVNAFEELSELSENTIIPIILEAEKEISPHSLNLLLEAMIPVPLINSQWIESFVGTARACSEVSFNKGLMDNLKEDNVLLYDFVNMMENTYDPKTEKMTIDGIYFRFFKTYEKDIFGEIKTNELISACEEIDPVIKKTKRFAKKVNNYVNKTSFIKRNLIKKYRRNYRLLVNSSKKLTVEPKIVSDLIQYVPENLFPIALTLEDLQSIENVQKRRYTK